MLQYYTTEALIIYFAELLSYYSGDIVLSRVQDDVFQDTYIINVHNGLWEIEPEIMQRRPFCVEEFHSSSMWNIRSQYLVPKKL